MTSIESFRERARGGAANVSRLVPVWRDVLLDSETPVAAFAKLRRGPFAFLLESAPAGGETWARYTFMGTEPRSAWKLQDGVVQDWTADKGWHNERRPADPLSDLEALLRDCEPVEVPEIGEFWSGAVGYFGYDVARIIERLPTPPVRGVEVPDALFVFTDALVIFDNLRSQARVVAAARVDPGASDAQLQAAHDAAMLTVDATMKRLRGPSVLEPLELNSAAPAAEGKSHYDKDKFLADVERIRQYIIAGDAFQVQLARRIDLPFDFSSTDLYRALRVINPSPYMYHLVLDGIEIVGSSPELLVRVGTTGTVTLRPIAGTRRRGRTPDDDARMTAELMADEKERAEHLMLVDLGRNDVGRIAKYGSVRVSELMVVERYSHVLHLVSQVDGELKDGLTAMDAFRASFPAGTLTGAPKVRAMQIIDEMEPERRGPYGGAVGYISAGVKRMDLAITIRTCVIANGVASVQAAAGIVYDSVPEHEFQEHQNKARALLTAIGQVRGANA
ncbi:MAG: anthranilate synthase component I [bacterium]